MNVITLSLLLALLSVEPAFAGESPPCGLAEYTIRFTPINGKKTVLCEAQRVEDKKKSRGLASIFFGKPKKLDTILDIPSALVNQTGTFSKSVGYPATQKLLEIQIKNGNPHGLVRRWSYQGDKTEESHYKDGMLSGVSTLYWDKTRFTPAGRIKEQASYRNGELDGIRIRKLSDIYACLISRERFKQGHLICQAGFSNIYVNNGLRGCGRDNGKCK